MDQWTNRPMDQWTNGPLDQWTYGTGVPWTNGPMDRWTNATNGPICNLVWLNSFLGLPWLKPISFQQLLVFGRSGANGQSALHLAPVARSSDSATATMLSRLLTVMAIQLRQLHASRSPPINQLVKMLSIQVAYRKKIKDLGA